MRTTAKPVDDLDRGAAHADQDWRLRGACVELDPEEFFPIGNKRPAVAQYEKMRAVCQVCEVRTPCLLFALSVGAEFGLWGGTTPAERQRIQRRADAATARRLSVARRRGRLGLPHIDGASTVQQVRDSAV